jgi:hypothetical protein
MMIEGCVVPPSSPHADSATAKASDDPTAAMPSDRFSDGALTPMAAI